MLPVETLTFTKEQRTLPCKIVRMQQDDLDTILNYQQKLCDALQDADIFVPLSRQEWQYLLDHGFALAVLPENSVCTNRSGHSAAQVLNQGLFHKQMKKLFRKERAL